MTMTSSPAPMQSSLIGWIAGNRERASYVFIAFGTVMIITMIFLALRWDRIPSEPQKEAAKSDKAKELLEKEAGKDSKVTPPADKNPDYLWAAVWAGAVGITLVGMGLWNINRQPHTDQEPFMARILILATGGTVGLLTALLGLKLGYHWEDFLSRWIKQGDIKDAQWVLAALAILIAGLAVTFVSLQQARTDIRNNPTIRRLVYGYDFGLTGLLLLILLVALNLVASAQLPATLDATEGGFYSLDEKSKQLLKDIHQPIHAYFISPNNSQASIFNDVRNLLANCAKINPKFTSAILIPSINGEELANLYDRLKIAESNQNRAGLILTVGEKEEHIGFIPYGEMAHLKQTEDPRQANEKSSESDRQWVFEGEPKIMTELLFLAEAKVKPVIYFTQGAGEPLLSPSPQAKSAVPTATLLATELGARYFDVRPITLREETNPRWMKEATALVIFGPNRAFTEQEVKVVRDYMKPADGSRGGKLFALLPPFANTPASREKIVGTGLEPLLSEFGVTVTTQQIYAQPFRGLNGLLPWIELVGDPQFLSSKNALAGLIQNRAIYLQFGIRPIQPNSVPGMNVEKMWVTGDENPCWLEPNNMQPGQNLLDTLKAFRDDPALAKEKSFGKQHVPVALLVSQGQQELSLPRAAVFGMRSFVTDASISQQQDGIFYIDLFAGVLDWLREKPSNIGISPRVHNLYNLNKNFDGTRLLWMPLGIMLVSIMGLGMGVWLMRRNL